MTGKQLLEKLQNSLNPDAEVFINTVQGKLKIVDVITHYDTEITIECVDPDTNENRYR